MKSRHIRKILVCTFKNAFMLLSTIFPIKRNKVVFSSFRGTQYSDNPRAISERLHEMDPGREIVWLFEDPEKKAAIIPSYIRCVGYASFQAIYELATALVWVDNNIKPEYIRKRKNQYYMQTWHGDRGPKAILYESKTSDPRRKYVETDGCNIMLTGSEFGERKLRNAFRYSGPFLKFGCPRNDILINQDLAKADSVREALGLDASKKLLLYAPTFREYCKYRSQAQDVGDINLSSLIDRLEKHTGQQWVCLLRRHHAVRAFKNYQTDNRIMDVSEYDEMSELMLISDMMITDYSSSSGDFPLTKRPLILYHPDIDSYRDERNLYYRIEDSPFLIARNQKELEDLACGTTTEMAAENCDEILRFYKIYETGSATAHAAELVAGWFKAGSKA